MDMGRMPYMLYADKQGRIFEHPHYRMVGFSADRPVAVIPEHLVQMPEFSKLFYLPECPPMGMDPDTGTFHWVPETRQGRRRVRCHAVAAFLEPGIVRTLLPAADYHRKPYTLPMWAYTAVGFRDGAYWAAGFHIEDNPRWDPRNYDDRQLLPAIDSFRRRGALGPLAEHLVRCATGNHCFAAKNLFLRRWEAPLPVSRRCNAACLGCLSHQPEHLCDASHERLGFKPSVEEIVELAVAHLQEAPEAIVSFGQGCEGEPLTEYRLLAASIRGIRKRTRRGTINLNTNGSRPDRIRVLAESGLDSIRISLNSARPDLYRAYYRPKGYDLRDVVQSLAVCVDRGLYTMINYLVFPGITDEPPEIEALSGILGETGVDFLHLKNLCIDPALYLDTLPGPRSPAVGIQPMAGILRRRFPRLQLGYFNQPLR